MTLQEILISLGEQPLSTSPYSASIRAVVMGGLGKKGDDVTRDTPGYIVLSKIHALTNEIKKEKMLNHSLTNIRSSDLYKQSLLLASAVVAMVAIVMALMVVYGDVTITPELTDVFKSTIHEFFELVKFIITDERTQSVVQDPAA